MADFNKDNFLDLAVGLRQRFGSFGARVLLGNGNGTFQPPLNINVGQPSFSIAVGDFNGDGIPDFAQTNNFGFDVSVRLGNGDGTLGGGWGGKPGDNPNSIAVGDFNGDDIPDLVVTDNLIGVQVLLGNGDGSFQDAMNFGPGALSIAVGDFNEDGKLDIAVGVAGIAVLTNNTPCNSNVHNRYQRPATPSLQGRLAR